MVFKYRNMLFAWFVFLTFIFAFYYILCITNNQVCARALRRLIISAILAVFTGWYAFANKN